MRKRPRSEEIFKNLCASIPGGVNSPVRSFKGLGMAPMVVDRGAGDLIYDVDGHEYIDFCLSWGPLIHGHAHPEIVAAIQERVAKGTTFGITSHAEEQLAQKVLGHFPSMEKIRFVSSGTEATMSAIRLARGYTKKTIVVKFAGNFHGHADYLLVQAGSGVLGLNSASTSLGIPEDTVRNTVCLPYNNTDVCRDFLSRPENRERIAAVIIEPIAGNMGVVPARAEFLQMLRDETAKSGALLIFDEVITGYRVGIGGAQALYKIQPDLTCLAKIIGGGLPAAAFGGRAEIMDFLAPLGEVYQAGTLSGNPVAMVAGLKTIELLERPDFYQKIQEKADLFTRPVLEWITKARFPVCLQQVGSMFTLFFGVREVNHLEDAKKADLELFAKYFRYMFENGVYIPPSQHETWFVSAVHKNDSLAKASELTIKFLEQLA